MRPWSFLSTVLRDSFRLFAWNDRKLDISILALYVTGLNVVSHPKPFEQGSSDLTTQQFLSWNSQISFKELPNWDMPLAMQNYRDCKRLNPSQLQSLVLLAMCYEGARSHHALRETECTMFCRNSVYSKCIEKDGVETYCCTSLFHSWCWAVLEHAQRMHYPFSLLLKFYM